METVFCRFAITRQESIFPLSCYVGWFAIINVRKYIDAVVTKRAYANYLTYYLSFCPVISNNSNIIGISPLLLIFLFEQVMRAKSLYYITYYLSIKALRSNTR